MKEDFRKRESSFFYPMKYLIPTLFFLFICWIIISADTATENVFVQFAHSLPYGDKMGHAFLFGLMAFLLNWAMAFHQIRVFQRPILLGSLIVLIFAIGEECTQLFFESRTFDGVDILFDIIGIGLISLLQLKFCTRHKKSSSYN